MKREEFKTVIKIFSDWKIDKRKGNYRLFEKKYLSDYLYELIERILDRNELAIKSDGNIDHLIGENLVFGGLMRDDEVIDPLEQERRIRCLAKELLQ